MISKELLAVKTPISFSEIFYSFGYAWIQLFNTQPTIDSLKLIVSHTALETGNYNSCYCYNLGNIKSVGADGRNYCFYKCNELVPLQQAKAMIASADKDGGLAKITTVRNDGLCWIEFYPQNKYCRFRAFESLNEGCIDHLSFLKFRYKPNTGIWDAVKEGNVSKFCHLLSVNKYYTADENIYTKAVMNVHKGLSKLNFDIDQLPVVSEIEKQKILDLVQITVIESNYNNY